MPQLRRTARNAVGEGFAAQGGAAAQLLERRRIFPQVGVRFVQIESAANEAVQFALDRSIFIGVQQRFVRRRGRHRAEGLQLFDAEELRDRAHGGGGPVRLAVGRISRDVRRAEVAERKKFAVDIRLVFPDVDRGVRDLAALQRGLERRTVRRFAARGVDETHSCLRGGEKLSVQKFHRRIFTVRHLGNM